MKRRFALALLLFGVPAWASAQLRGGSEFRVNTYTPGDQIYPAVGVDASGNFVVVWQSQYREGSSTGLFGRRYDAAGRALGSEFHVNTFTTSDQSRPRVASDAIGNFVVVWQSGGQDGSGSGIFAQRYDAAGAPLGTEFRVNSYTPDDQVLASVASDASGNFVVVWRSSAQDGSGQGIFGQRYDAAGAPRGAEFQVNTYATGDQRYPSVASDANGDFVVAWDSVLQDGSATGVFAQRYDASGTPLGSEFRVNTYTTSYQGSPAVALDGAGNFVVAWNSYRQDGSQGGIFAQRYDASGAPRGAEFRVNNETVWQQFAPSVASDVDGNFVVVWTCIGQDGDMAGIFARRYDATGAPISDEFPVNTYISSYQEAAAVASGPAGNTVVVWQSTWQDGSGLGVFGQRLGGLAPAAVKVDPVATAGSDGNGVLEPGETVELRPSWSNLTDVAQAVTGEASAFDGPPAVGVSYSLLDATGGYGIAASGATVVCSDCYQVAVDFAGVRPALHWDATLTETIAANGRALTTAWPLHVGESFTDVPTASSYYRFVEAMLHHAVTGGCAETDYCPADTTTREQMAAFALVAKEGSGYLPVACTTPMFTDVPASSPYCRWIEELARRGVVSGCGSGSFCPTAQVSREQMPVFMLRTLDPALTPPDCATPAFGDVPASSPYCKWIEELARRGVVTGCGNGNYCSTGAVTREQMAVFVSATFGLTLYGP